VVLDCCVLYIKHLVTQLRQQGKQQTKAGRHSSLQVAASCTHMDTETAEPRSSPCATMQMCSGDADILPSLSNKMMPVDVNQHQPCAASQRSHEEIKAKTSQLPASNAPSTGCLETNFGLALPVMCCSSRCMQVTWARLTAPHTTHLTFAITMPWNRICTPGLIKTLFSNSWKSISP
jgi:hypothetical protein